jgi:hypothetical protein
VVYHLREVTVMSRNAPVLELLMFALAFAGCSSSTKSGLSGDGSASGPDSARYGGEDDVAAADAAGGASGWDSADGRGTEDLGPIADAPVTPRDGGGSETGSTDVPKAMGDSPLQLVDGALVIDAPSGAVDLARPGSDGLSVRDVSDSGGGSIPDLGQGDTIGGRYDSSSPYLVCDLGPAFNMPADQIAVPDTYGVCIPPAGKSMSDVAWSYAMPAGRGTIAQDGLKVLSSVVTCTDLADAGDVSGSPTGTPIKAILAVKPESPRPTEVTPERVFVIYEDSSGARVQAVYDLTFLQANYRYGLPPYPEPYFRLSPACGSADAIPFLKGWTGRIGHILSLATVIKPDGKRYNRTEMVLFGSAEGESQAKAFWFTNDLLLPP